MMLTVPAPAPDRLDGVRLRQQFAAAGMTLPDDVVVVGGRLVFPSLPESQRDAVQSALSAHMTQPQRPDPSAEFAAAVKAATTVDGLKAALLGTSGPGAEPRRSN